MANDHHTDPFIRVEINGPVQTVTIARPEKKNALSMSMYRALTAALHAADAQDDLAATVIFGQPGIFCAGNDINDFISMGLAAAELVAGTSDTGADDIDLANVAAPVLDFLLALVHAKKPLIAAVDGPGVGIGTTLLLHCDLAFATPQSQFSTPFARLGITPEAGSSVLMPQRIGHQVAFELLVLGARITAERAHQVGLVNDVVAPDQLQQTALSAAQALANVPRDAMMKSRAMMRPDPQVLEQVVRREAAEFTRRLASPDAKAAFMAFLSGAA